MMSTRRIDALDLAISFNMSACTRGVCQGLVVQRILECVGVHVRSRAVVGHALSRLVRM